MKKDNHNPPTISFDDDWITINGVTFSTEPYFSEIAALLGPPDLIDHTKKQDGKVVGTCYCWYAHGISAYSPYIDDTLTGPSNQDSTRPQRVSILRLLITANQVAAVGGWGGSKPTLLPPIDRLEAFKGDLAICGVSFRTGTTVEQLVSMKSGRAIVIPDDERVWAATPGLGVGAIAVAPTLNDPVKANLGKPIATIDLFIEEWRHPSDELLKIPLVGGERIINSVTTEQNKGVFFDALLTNRRLTVVASALPSPRQWNLDTFPQIIWEGLVRIPAELSEVVLLSIGLLIVGLLGVGAYALWPGVWATICLVIAVLCGFSMLMVAREEYYSRDHFAVQLRIKASGVEDTVVLFHDPFRFGASPVARLIHRLSCEVSRLAPTSTAPVQDSVSAISPPNESAATLKRIADALEKQQTETVGGGRRLQHGKRIADLEWKWYPRIFGVLVAGIALLLLAWVLGFFHM